MPSLRGFSLPRSPTGRASILPAPPWHYSGELLTVEYRTSPDRVAELLPDPLQPADEDPGAVAFLVADWQSWSDGGEELLDPVRAQYREAFFVVRCKYQGKHFSRCVYIWVDRDFALVRGHHQGYPKKLGSVALTRPVTVGRAGPRLEPGAKLAGTLAAGDRRLADAVVTLTAPSPTAGFVNALAMLHNRWMPAVESDGKDALDELVTMSATDVEVGSTWAGEPELCLYDSPTEEHFRLEPLEMIGGYWRNVGMTWRGGTTLERRSSPTPAVRENRSSQ